MDADHSGRGDEAGDPAPKRVFISYAHDSVGHGRDVEALASLLSDQVCVQVTVDQWADARRRSWPEWARRNIAACDYVVAVASPEYRRAAEGDLGADQHRGAQSETLLLQELLQQNRPIWRGRILPVVLPGCSVDDIPTFLHPRTETHYLVPRLDCPGVRELVAAILADGDQTCDGSIVTRSDGRLISEAVDLTHLMVPSAVAAPVGESASSVDDAGPVERGFGVIEWLGQPILWYQNGVRAAFVRWQAHRREGRYG
jgi:hypothetical protein